MSDIIKLDECDSTNKYLKDNLSKLKSAAVVYTLNQKAGRGRLGRSWAGSSGGMLAFSVLLDLEEFGLDRKDIPLISLLSAVATAAELEAICRFYSDEKVEVKIKWPNDVLLSRNGGGFKKVCGILCEGSLDFGEHSKDFIVVGIGINLTQPRSFFEEGGIPHAGSVFENPKLEMDFDKLVLSLRDNIFQEIQFYKNEKTQYLSSRFSCFDILQGKDIVILSLSGEVLKSGIALGVDFEGALLIKARDSDTAEKVYAGDISVRQNDFKNNKGTFGYI